LLWRPMPWRSSLERRAAQRRAQASAERLIRRLTAKLAPYTRDGPQWVAREVKAREDLSRPALTALVGGQGFGHELKLRRNVAQHSEELPAAGASAAQFRRAQRGPRLEARVEDPTVACPQYAPPSDTVGREVRMAPHKSPPPFCAVVISRSVEFRFLPSETVVHHYQVVQVPPVVSAPGPLSCAVVGASASSLPVRGPSLGAFSNSSSSLAVPAIASALPSSSGSWVSGADPWSSGGAPVLEAPALEKRTSLYGDFTMGKDAWCPQRNMACGGQAGCGIVNPGARRWTTPSGPARGPNMRDFLIMVSASRLNVPCFPEVRPHPMLADRPCRVPETLQGRWFAVYAALVDAVFPLVRHPTRSLSCRMLTSSSCSAGSGFQVGMSSSHRVGEVGVGAFPSLFAPGSGGRIRSAGGEALFQPNTFRPPDRPLVLSYRVPRQAPN